MSDENLRPESRKETPAAETAEPSETTRGLTEMDTDMADDLIQDTMLKFLEDGSDRYDVSVGRLLRERSQFEGEGNIVDASGNPIEHGRARDLNKRPIEMPREDLNVMKQLSDKTTEILQVAALAQERIGKDQQEIEQLKMETRAMLARLRAA